MSRSRTLRAGVAGAAILLHACASFSPEIGPLQGETAATGGDDASGAGDASAGDDGSVAAGDATASDDGTVAGDAAAADATLDTTSPPEAGPQTWTVVVGANGTHAFGPATVTVHVGDTVHWVWQQSGHTVTSGTSGTADGVFCSPGDTGCSSAPTSGAGATYDHTFTAPGAYHYFCRLHWDSGMVGAVLVQ